MIINSDLLSAALFKAQSECLMTLNGSLNENSPTLYHYTDLNAGVAILEKSSLRFTDIKYCNDPEEFENGLKILNKVSDEIFDSYFKKSPQFILVMSFIRHILNLSTSFKHSEEQLLLDARVKLAKYDIDSTKFPYKKTSIFVCCFSERSDDLRQWLPYANDGRGVALGVKGMANNQHDLTVDDDTWAIKVCYETEAKKEQYVAALFEGAFKIFNDIHRTLIPDFVSHMYRSMLFDIIACKSENYKDEDEWRLIRTLETDDGLGLIHFKIRDNIVRPYMEVPIKKESILEIKLGPKTETSLNTHALDSATRKFGYPNTKISKSKISYR